VVSKGHEIMSSDLSSTMRDYLAEVYILSETAQDEKNFVSTSTLAEMMNVSAPAVNRMVTKLKDMGLLHHEPYQGITLTESGIREALIKLRYQRIAEAFLVKVMNFGWHEVQTDAHRMSSALSEPLAQRMLEMAGNPQYSPCGEPIPTVDGTIEVLNDQPLNHVSDGETVTITRVRTREADRLEYIAALGLLPGTQVTVIHKAPFHGPIQLKLNNEYRIIGHSLAELIYAR